MKDFSNDYVCFECGVGHLTEEQKKNSRCTTFHKSECCVCREVKSVTHIRHYNYLSNENIHGRTKD